MKSIISFFTAIVATITMLWNTAMTKVDPDGLRYIALNAAKSYFISQTNDEVEALKEKTGGFMKAQTAMPGKSGTFAWNALARSAMARAVRLRAFAAAAGCPSLAIPPLLPPPSTARMPNATASSRCFPECQRPSSSPLPIRHPAMSGCWSLYTTTR